MLQEHRESAISDMKTCHKLPVTNIYANISLTVFWI